MSENSFKPEDFIQPSDPRFKKIYGHDPIADAKKKQKEKGEKEEAEKAKLEEKYWRMKKDQKIKPDGEKFLRKTVLYKDRW